MSRESRQRLGADARRASILDVAIELFSERGFSGTTTAVISQRAAINEALVFRHFGSKQQLYLASIDAAWERVRAVCQHRMDELSPAERWRGVGGGFLELEREEPAIARLWVRALVDATAIPVIDDHVAGVMSDVHEFVAAAITASQAAGGIPADKDAHVEAWILVALGLLGSVGLRLPGFGEHQFEHVIAAHRACLTQS
jgi:AcrR family transcriptional regulator